MKRSEMLLLIAKELHSKAMPFDFERNTYRSDFDFNTFKDVWLSDADELLSKIEGMGMLPPKIATNASGWDVGRGLPAFISEWEQE